MKLLSRIGIFLGGIGAFCLLLALPQHTPSAAEKQVYVVQKAIPSATQPNEIWLRPTHAPAFVFRVEAGDTPESGTLICTAHSERKQVGEVSYPVQYLSCEGGRKLTLTGVDWEH